MMDLTSPILQNKFSISRNESLQREKEEPSPIASGELIETQELMVQRCVIIQKDEKGYGLTVSGDNPVFVQSVKEDGAAARAGVQQGDRIIKVNGTLVTQSNHEEVVELIKSGSYVALTLLGKPPGQGKAVSPTLNLTGTTTNLNVINSNKLGTSDRITGPQPVDYEKQLQLNNSRIHTIRKMLEKEVVYLENLRSEFSRTPSEKIRSEMNGAMKRVKTLEDQLFNLTGLPHEQIVTRSPKSPPLSGRHNHEKESFRSVSFPTPGHHSRSLTHQVSAPTLPSNKDTTSAHQLGVTTMPKTTDLSDLKLHPQQMAPPQYSELSTEPDFPKPSILSTSLENIVRHLSPRTTTWPQPTHTRQSSSPDTIVYGIETPKCQKSNGCSVQRIDSMYRSPLSPQSHTYKSFTPDPVPEIKPNQPLNTSGGSSVGQYDSAAESPAPSPPPTPPEPVEAKGNIGDSFEGDDLMQHEEYGTPPEGSTGDVNMQSVISKLGQNPSIICMEDDDFSSDTEISHLEDHGPFNGLWKLLRNPAHLAVFMQFLMSNSDPSSLFFYLITDMYEQGTAKEMKKWAYEIHSSFLVPGAPLKVPLVDETILHEIDEVLLTHIEKEDILRTVFRKARKKAKEELNDLLAVFRNKRTMGFANIYGPPDYQLEEAMNDKTKELKIIEQVLVPCFETFSEDLDSVDDRTSAKALALATVLKQYGVKSQQSPSFLERCPTFVAKDRSRLRFLQRNKKVMFIQGHHFAPEHYYSVTYCNHCQLIIWGVGNQGYQCQNCEMNIHKSCVKVVEERCIGALRNKKDKKRMSGIMENFIGKTRKPSQPVPAAIERAKRLNEEMNADNGFSSHPDSYHLEPGQDGGERVREDLREPSDIVFQNMLNLSETFDKPSSKKSTSIGRSESFRQRRESKPSFRKRSDPNIPRSKSDVEVDDKHTSGLNESHSSSNSSLSNRSLDSPSNSSEMVHRTPTSVSADSVPPNFAPTSGFTSSPHAPPAMHTYDDSDLEAEADPPNWQENVDWDVLRVIKPKEKKRQDVINELFHTERTHVRNLKVLDQLFYKPMLQEQLLPQDFLHLLFPNLEEMLEIHTNFNNKMKARRKTENVILDIGQLMLEMFDGTAGDHLKQAAATYCQNQSIALEHLKIRQKKDQKLAQSLSDAEVNNLCRRLQLKDIIASGFQRLTKYPLLLENIAKYTPPDTQELTDLLRAVDCSKEILVHVDSAIKEAENRHRLLDIQKKLEKSAFEKVDHAIVHSFPNLDVTKHRLLHEGPLTWRLNKQKSIEMHVVLLEDILVLFQKQDEKYILKFHNTNLTTAREDNKIMHSPILRVQNLLIRNNAIDKKSIFLISSSEMHAMYEFVATTASEMKIWCQQLSKAIELKTHSGNLLRNHQEVTPVTAADPVLLHEGQPEDAEVKAKESDQPDPTEESKTNTEPLEQTDSSKPDDATVIESETPSNDLSDKAEKAVTSTSDDERPDLESRAQRRIQRVEILRIEEGPQLIEPSEVIVSGRAVFETAEPVLTSLEMLRRKDQQIVNAIQEKENLLAEMFQMSPEDLESHCEVFDETKDYSAPDLVLTAVQHATKLSSLINKGLNIVEDSSICSDTSTLSLNDGAGSIDSCNSSRPTSSEFSSRLQGIPHQSLLPVSTSLSKCLTQLMSLINDYEEERKQLRNELLSSREQIHQLHETHRHCMVPSQSPSSHSLTQSRPSSFVSVASTTSEGLADFFDHQQLFSVLEKSEEPPSTEKEPPQSVSPSDVQFSSPVSEIVPTAERWKTERTESVDNGPTQQQLDVQPADTNCDVQNNSVILGEQFCDGDKSEKVDSPCRTVEAEKSPSADPIYL